MTKEKRSILKKIWDFLWKSNSIWSWIADLILVFIIVKFIIFPFFGLIFATSLPFVIIESCSLEHGITSCNTDKLPAICGETSSEERFLEFDEYWQFCGDWYENKNITKQQFETMPYSGGLYKGDIIVLIGKKTQEYKIGDIIIFKVGKQTTPIIHRIINIENEGNELVFSTKGDHNSGQHNYEVSIKQEQILGKAAFRIPGIGWAKLFFFEIFR